MTAGHQLKQVREKLGLRYRDVETASKKIGAEHNSADYVIALSRLADIENKGVTPNLFRLYTLCAIYRLDISEVLGWYGINVAQLFADSLYILPDHSHPVHTRNGRIAPPGAIDLPIELDPGFDPSKNTYLTRMIQKWGRVPLAMIDKLDFEHFHYATIGTDDLFMSPMLPPGTLLQVDINDTEIVQSGWKNEFERPIYFFEMRDRYVCSWCNLADGMLILQPHSLSPAKPTLLKHGPDADVVGRVVGYATQLPRESSPDDEDVPPTRKKRRKKPRPE